MIKEFIELVAHFSKTPLPQQSKEFFVNRLQDFSSRIETSKLELYNGHLSEEKERSYEARLLSIKKEFEVKIPKILGNQDEYSMMDADDKASQINAFLERAELLILEFKEECHKTKKPFADTPYDEDCEYYPEGLRRPFSIKKEVPYYMAKTSCFDPEDIPKNPQNYLFNLSKTTPQHLVITKISDSTPANAAAERAAEIDHEEATFIICITTCPTINESKKAVVSTVVEKTTKKASSDDWEVFDGMRQFDSMFKPQKPHFGCLQFATPDEVIRSALDIIKEDHQLSERMILAATINQKTHKKNDKMSVIILTDSKNLVLGGNDGFPMEAILDKVPFESFKDNNIRDITIELISCNTIEICQKTTEQIAALAKTHQMKISVRFCDKFIFNNISYIHLREATNQHIFDLLLKQKKASKDQEPAMSWNDIVNEASFRKKFQSTVTHFFQNSSEKQETALIPVEDLGFVTTTLGAGDLSGIKEKKFPLSNTATMIHLTPQPDAAGADAATAYEETQKAATAASFKIVKKMLEPKVTFRGGGDFYLWSADYREPELIVAKKAALSRPLSPTSAHKMQEVTGLLTNTA